MEALEFFLVLYIFEIEKSKKENSKRNYDSG
jgi:hypothetical protein